MTYAVGAQGFIGIEAESTPGTYIAPTIFLPLLEESLSFNQVQIQRRPFVALLTCRVCCLVIRVLLAR